MKEKNYIKDEDFKKLTKKQKLELQSCNWFDEVEINKLILIPTNEKMSGYCVGHFFAYTNNKGWWKPMVYDCWQINTAIDTKETATPRFQILKGDFENGGVQIFGFMDEHHKAYIRYGGEIIIRKIIN